MLKEYIDREGKNSVENTVKPMTPIVTLKNEKQDFVEKKFMGCKLKNSSVLNKLDSKLEHLSISQSDIIKGIICEYPQLTKDTPGQSWFNMMLNC